MPTDVSTDTQRVRMQPIELYEGRKPAGGATYTVTIRTGDCKGAGTDANVSVTLHGAAGTHGPVLLEASKLDFDRRRCDMFPVRTRAPLGAIRSIVLSHDATGPAPDWYVCDVVVACEGQLDALFTLEDWLKSPHLSREIFATQGTAPRVKKRCAAVLCCAVLVTNPSSEP